MLILGPQLVAMGWLQKLGDRCQMVQLERSQTREGFAQQSIELFISFLAVS